MTRPQPTRPDLMPVLRSGCTCREDGRRNPACRVHTDQGDDDA